MAAEVFNGSALAERIRSTIKPRVEELREKGAAVRLDAILVGQPEAGVMFARSQQKRCERFGIEYRLHTLGEDIDDTTLQGYIRQLSTDPAVTGVMLNLPLPSHLDAPAAQYAIDPYKDVEGVNPANIGMLFYGSPIIAPCTAMAVLEILAEIGIQVRGKPVAVIGQGNIVGKPIALYMMGQEATVLTCNKYTEDLAAVTCQADVVVAAAGVAELVGPGTHS
jgi:methylenetetrahydrofolate dehydrogenase (NADP+)/methenyltetrahydrofolate cyclohydrolase